MLMPSQAVGRAAVPGEPVAPAGWYRAGPRNRIQPVRVTGLGRFAHP